MAHVQFDGKYLLEHCSLAVTNSQGNSFTTIPMTKKPDFGVIPNEMRISKDASPEKVQRYISNELPFGVRLANLSQKDFQSITDGIKELSYLVWLHHNETYRKEFSITEAAVISLWNVNTNNSCVVINPETVDMDTCSFSLKALLFNGKYVSFDNNDYLSVGSQPLRLRKCPLQGVYNISLNNFSAMLKEKGIKKDSDYPIFFVECKTANGEVHYSAPLIIVLKSKSYNDVIQQYKSQYSFL